ncbi:hypothetical protein HYPSUDRAFT_72107 [Hypholoma sublateritium FD-334 SS-4]|uniref:Uncharacterized protein n=1 Tax=Hypholoma sublateritium (strain FD-334 SS-4) TaxID=945553 RepID=A0A0D2NF74_HYPSF|nr:hypothetical protein HYPSUDRAFT_72107 [Hypholoma sublateritium FD-334 SS-4]
MGKLYFSCTNCWDNSILRKTEYPNDTDGPENSKVFSPAAWVTARLFPSESCSSRRRKSVLQHLACLRPLPVLISPVHSPHPLTQAFPPASCPLLASTSPVRSLLPPSCRRIAPTSSDRSLCPLGCFPPAACVDFARPLTSCNMRR